MSEPRETAKKLVRQAIDTGVTKEEGRTFAVKAVEYIDKHQLLDGPDATVAQRMTSFWRGMPIDRIIAGVNTGTLAAAAIEIAQLRMENARLRERLDRAQAPQPSLKRRKRRRRHFW